MTSACIIRHCVLHSVSEVGSIVQITGVCHHKLLQMVLSYGYVETFAGSRNKRQRFIIAHPHLEVMIIDSLSKLVGVQ